eukprot:scaffold20530_cov68-Phaeocystis_antarctica.AAC.1
MLLETPPVNVSSRVRLSAHGSAARAASSMERCWARRSPTVAVAARSALVVRTVRPCSARFMAS